MTSKVNADVDMMDSSYHSTPSLSAIPASRSPLLTIPDEVLLKIAYHLSLPSTSHASASPHSLVSFLLASRRINDTLSLDRNPRLYAELFAVSFDAGAAKRRFVQNASDQSGGEHEGGEEGLNARAFAEEFRKRCAGLRRLRDLVKKGDVKGLEEQDAWMVYLMLVENDGKNILQLTSRPSPFEPPLFPTLLQLYHTQDLVPSTLRSGYPTTDATRTLMIWIIWLLTTTAGISNSSTADLEEFVFVLRPYVFAAKQYDICFAPWTLEGLPISRSGGGSNGRAQPDHPLLDPWRANLAPTSRMSTITHYGRPLSVCPPILTLAANLNFFARVDQLAGVPAADRAWTTGPGDAAGDESRTQGQQTESDLGGTGLTGSSNHTATMAVVPYRPRPRPRTNRRHVASRSGGDSREHDRDFERLTSCWDPSVSRGMGLKDWAGAFEGCWEGNFSFFDFESYRNMLIAGARALYEGQYGEQTSVWRMNEVYVRPKRDRARSSSTTSQSAPTATFSLGEDASADAILNAGFPAGTSAFDNLMRQAAGRLHPSNATAYIVNVLESDKRDQYIVSMLSGMEDKEVVSKEEVKRILERESRGKTAEEEEMEGRSKAARARRSSEVSGGREDVDMESEFETTLEADTGTSEDIEILLVGTGHSAWGEFIVRGRVRRWDGLITLVKEYSPENRGRWLYRGYIIAGNIFVGRWRDCVTPSHLVGYEGTFSMALRGDRG